MLIFAAKVLVIALQCVLSASDVFCNIPCVRTTIFQFKTTKNHINSMNSRRRLIGSSLATYHIILYENTKLFPADMKTKIWYNWLTCFPRQLCSHRSINTEKQFNLRLLVYIKRILLTRLLLRFQNVFEILKSFLHLLATQRIVFL